MNVKQETPVQFSKAAKRKLWAWLIGALIISVLLQFWIAPYKVLGPSGSFWFYPLFGFIASVALVLVSKLLGKLLKRPQSYWEDRS